MERFTLFAAGSLARLLSALAAFYSDWLFNRLLDGADAGIDFVSDVIEFGHWLVGMIAQRVCGQRGRGHIDLDDWQPELFSR